MKQRQEMGTFSISSLVLLYWAVTGGTASCVLKDVQFSSIAETMYFDIRSQFSVEPVYNHGMQNRSQIVRDENSGAYWRTLLPKRCLLTSCGAWSFVRNNDWVTDGTKEVWFTMQLRVASNFKFVKGGVLPGVCGENCPTSCGSESPGTRDGWSARFHFDSGGALALLLFNRQNSNHLEVCGEKFILRDEQDNPKIVQPGVWHKVEMQVKIESPKSFNPFDTSSSNIAVWLDDKLAGNFTNLPMKVLPNGRKQVHGMLLHMFYDGGDDTFAAQSDTWIDFKSFSLSRCRLLVQPIIEPTVLPTTAPDLGSMPPSTPYFAEFPTLEVTLPLCTSVLLLGGVVYYRQVRRTGDNSITSPGPPRRYLRSSVAALFTPRQDKNNLHNEHHAHGSVNFVLVGLSGKQSKLHELNGMEYHRKQSTKKKHDEYYRRERLKGHRKNRKGKQAPSVMTSKKMYKESRNPLFGRAQVAPQTAASTSKQVSKNGSYCTCGIESATDTKEMMDVEFEKLKRLCIGLKLLVCDEDDRISLLRRIAQHKTVVVPNVDSVCQRCFRSNRVGKVE